MARLLILGGTAEAAELARHGSPAMDRHLETVTSLAGCTRLPNSARGRVRRGGFGGPEGPRRVPEPTALRRARRRDASFRRTDRRHAAEAAENPRRRGKNCAPAL